AAVDVRDAAAAQIWRGRFLQPKGRDLGVAADAVSVQQRGSRIARACVVHAKQTRDPRLEDARVVEAATRHRPGELDAPLTRNGRQIVDGLGEARLGRHGVAAAAAGAENDDDDDDDGDDGDGVLAPAAAHEPRRARASASARATAAGAVPPVKARALSDASTGRASRTSASMRGEKPPRATGGSAS